MDKKRVWISAGIILNPSNEQVFITQRASKAHQGGLWEFAGGKVESGETAEQAVIRELDEEVGIQATEVEHLMKLEHDYPDKALEFDFFLIKRFNGEPFGKEGQLGQWVRVDKLTDYPFPTANVPVLERLTMLLEQ